MTKIALFGTSADPPTAGHQIILSWLAQNYDLVAVWASDNPFKNHQTSLQHRTEMLRLLITELEPHQDNIQVYEELSHRRSLVTVKKARKIWGNETEFTLVIGSDLISQIRSWYHVQELLTQVQILIVPRPGYPINKEDLEALQILGGKYLIADLIPPPVSSTAYRQSKDEEVVTQPIAAYINQERLYA